MARLYLLTEEHIKSGKRPKTPNQTKKKIIQFLLLVCLAEAAYIYYLLSSVC